MQRATSNLEYGSPSNTASSLSWQTHPASSPRSPEAVLRLCVFHGSWALCTSFGKRRGGSLLFSVGTFQFVGGPPPLCYTLLHHGALIFLILYISWKHKDLGDSKKHTTGLVHSYPRASTKPKKDLFPEKMESFISTAQRPARGLQCTVMRRRERDKGGGGGGRGEKKEGSQGGEEGGNCSQT